MATVERPARPLHLWFRTDALVHSGRRCSAVLSSWHPEFGSWMVEATPGAPYAGDTSDLLLVQANMAER